MKRIPITSELVNNPEFYFHTYEWMDQIALFTNLSDKDHIHHSSHAARNTSGFLFAPIKQLLEHPALAALEQKPIHFIFMTDFCGSSLFARALHAIKGLFCYKEPRAFVSLAVEKRRIDLEKTGNREQWNAAMHIASKLMSRTFRLGDISLIKDQPLTNYIIGDLLHSLEDSRAIFMYSSLSDYLAAVFRQDRRRRYVRSRMTTAFHETSEIAAISHIDKSSLNDTQIAALHWITQMHHYLSLNSEDSKHAICSLRSDVFLDNPVLTLKKATEYFGINISTSEVKGIVNGTIFNTHSKQIGAPFDNNSRKQQVFASQLKYRHEIMEGILWAKPILRELQIPDILPTPLISPAIQQTDAAQHTQA